MKQLIIASTAIGVLLSGQMVQAQSTHATQNPLIKGTIVWPAAKDFTDAASFLEANQQNTITQARLSEIAAKKGTSKDVRAFADQMLDENNMQTGSLQTIAGTRGLNTSVVLDPTHQWRVARITDLPKDIFNVAYLAQLNEDQVEELGALEDLPANLDPSLKSWAEQRKAALRSDIVAGAWVGVKRHKSQVATNLSGSGM